MSIFRSISRIVPIVGNGTELYLRCLKKINKDFVRNLVGDEVIVDEIGSRNGFILKFNDREKAANTYDLLKKNPDYVVRFAFKSPKNSINNEEV